jgi:hypothetical protein
MTVGEVDIWLSDRPDGCGFYSGAARRGDAVVRVNVLPPAFLWAGDFPLDDYKPDPTHWQVFADGELIARIVRQEDVGASLVPLLGEGRW